MYARGAYSGDTRTRGEDRFEEAFKGGALSVGDCGLAPKEGPEVTLGCGLLASLLEG